MAKSVKQLQRSVDDWVKRNGGYWGPFEQLAALLEEMGEIATELHHLHGPKKKKRSDFGSSLDEELGDLLFLLLAMANANNVDLEKSFERVLKKFNIRDKKRYVKRKAKK